MYEVEVDEAVRDRRDTRADQILVDLGQKFGIIQKGKDPDRVQMSKTRERVKAIHDGERKIRFAFGNPGDSAKLDRELINGFGDLREVSRSDAEVVLEVKTDFLEQIRQSAIDQARETISNRIDELGLKETGVVTQDNFIIVEVPGADRTVFDRIRSIISTTARLEFKIVDDESSFIDDLKDLPKDIEKQMEIVSAGAEKQRVPSSYLVARGPNARQRLAAYVDSLNKAGRIPEGHTLNLGRLDRTDDEKPGQPGETAWRTYYLFSLVEVTGQGIEDSFVANDPQTSKPYVAVTFNDDGADKFRHLTGNNVKRRMAIVLDERVESAPVIQTEIGKHCQITLGGYRGYNEILNEAKDLVVVLKAGALPVPIRPANEQMIGPTLGRDAIQNGVKAALAGVALVLIFMLVYYEVGGLVADVMVVLNLLLLMGAMAFLGVTLTLPGIAGIALTIGMAVDANVLINERMREELRAGKSVRAVVDQGFDRAFWSIFDSQLTTFLAALVMFQYGTGPIKGFAINLMIGIVTSLFTGVFCSHMMFDWIARGIKVNRLRIG
jgi:preprotein translocase subunit SecD